MVNVFVFCFCHLKTIQIINRGDGEQRRKSRSKNIPAEERQQRWPSRITRERAQETKQVDGVERKYHGHGELDEKPKDGTVEIETERKRNKE